MIEFKKYIKLENMIIFLLILYLFFLSRRGGDSKYRVACVLSIIGAIKFYKNKYFINNKILKLSILLGGLYTIFVTLIYIITPDKVNKLEFLLSISYFSIIFSFFISNLEIPSRIVKYIPWCLILMTLPSIYRGFKDVIEHKNILSYYRIHGGNWTTVYAGEVGLYFIIGIIFLVFFKKWYWKLIAIFYIFANSFLIYFCKSRNGIISIFITLIILIFIQYKNDIKKAVICIFFLLGILFLGLNLAENSKYIQRIGNLASINKIEKETRVPIYIDGVKLIKENIYTGQGFYSYLNNRYVVAKTKEHIIHFHNNFIELSITQGLIMCLLYFSYFLTLIIYFIKKIQLGDKTIKLYSYLALGGIIFYQAYGLFDSSIYMTKFTDLTFLLITLGIINTRKSTNNL